MSDNNIDQKLNNNIDQKLNNNILLDNNCIYSCLWEISGGEYKGCNVGGWIATDSDTSSCNDCSSSRFQPLCK